MYKNAIPADTMTRPTKAINRVLSNGTTARQDVKTSNNRTIYITESDMKKLKPLLDNARNSRDDLRSLKAELDLARVVLPSEIPADVITMNSRARLYDPVTGEKMVYTLAFPADASIEEERISVLAPVGTAMLGRRAGDEFQWLVPAGPIRLRVEEVLYQPEAAGDYHL